MTIGVHTDLEAYRIAIAELPLRAFAVDDPAASVAVVSGEGEWWRSATDAIADAAAVVVARPGRAPVDAVEALLSAAGRTPVVLDRPLLRPDAVAAVAAKLPALGPAAVLTIECHAPDGALLPALRDAVGWARVLVRASITPKTSESWGGRALALLESAGHEAVSVLAATQAGAPPLGRLRITALAETLVEIDDDGDLVMAMTDAGGRRTLPSLFERPERLAVRRAIEAVHAHGRVPDLGDLRHDVAIAETVAAASDS